MGIEQKTGQSTSTTTMHFDLTDGVKAVVQEALEPYKRQIAALESRIEALESQITQVRGPATAG